MTARFFVDSNVLVYARDPTEPEKQRRAEAWLERLWVEKSGRVSQQVLNECYVAVVRRWGPGIEYESARRYVGMFLAWEPVPVDRRLMESGWSVQDRFGFSWWDCLIVAAARIAGCNHLLTEDLQHGQDLDGVTVIDPFRTAPDVRMA